MYGNRELLKVGDIAAVLRVSRSRVYQLIADKSLPAVRRGRSILIPRTAWESWLTAQSDHALAAVQNTTKPTPMSDRP